MHRFEKMWLGFIVSTAIACSVLVFFLNRSADNMKARFEAACEKTGGITAWDYRQWQCLK